ncbi:hypothetical protein [Fibrella arboris]|uniref:hypothetical protein n=1 Tax=Fibrella arboris TaxID=3242486 RepID=UPI0035214351
MKPVKFLLSSLALVLLLFSHISSMAQQLIAVGGLYTQSVEPAKDIDFLFDSQNAYSTYGCEVTWKGTNAAGAAALPGGVTLSGTDHYVAKFLNVSGTGSLTATLSDCFYSASDGKTVSYSAPIRYLGPLGTLSLNSSSANPQSVGCGAQTVTLSVGAATNATNYAWDLSNLPGWTITSGQNTNTITATTSAGTGGTIQVKATRNDASAVESTRTIAVNRPSPPSVSSTLSGNA